MMPRRSSPSSALLLLLAATGGVAVAGAIPTTTAVVVARNDNTPPRRHQRMLPPSLCPLDLDGLIDVNGDGTVVLRYSLVSSFLCARLEVSMTNDIDDIDDDVDVENYGWIGFALSSHGGMDGGHAAIGILGSGEEEGEEGVVGRYDLGRSDWRGYATPIVEEEEGEEIGPQRQQQQHQEDDDAVLRDASAFVEEYDIDDIGGGGGGKRGRRAVMSFAWPLADDDETDEEEDGSLSSTSTRMTIRARGTNRFLYARGPISHSSMGIANPAYHAERTTFVKNFLDDITEVPTTSPTRLVERYFCSWDANVKSHEEDEICVDIDDDPASLVDDDAKNAIPIEWHDSSDACDTRCSDDPDGQGPNCLSVTCATTTTKTTFEPTSKPTTKSPTKSPTTSIPSTVVPTTSTPSSRSPSSSSGGFAFDAPSDADAVRTVPLSPFVVDFALGAKTTTTGEAARHRHRHRRGLRILRGEDTVARDVELLSIVSDHLLGRFGIKLGVTPLGVELVVLDRREGTGEGSVSYVYAGNAVYRLADGVPTTAVLDSEVLRAFNRPPGKAACMEALSSSDDVVVRGITDVFASTRDGDDDVGEDPSVAADAVVDDPSAVDDPIEEGYGGMGTASIVFAVLLGTAFAAVVGLLAVRKYGRYRRNNANNEYVSYLNRKRDGGGGGSPTTKKISVDKRVLRVKRYFNFESPKDGRSVIGAEEEEGRGGVVDPMYDDLEIVGGDTYPASQEFTDDDNPKTVSPRGQFDPSGGDASLPYDEGATTKGEGSPLGASTHDMIYFSHIANQMTEDQLDGSHATVDDLYSDKDSYFHSYVGGGQDKDTIQSLHSLDSLDNTFGFADHSISHLIDGIEVMLEKKDMEEKAASSRGVGGGSRNIDSLDVVSSHQLPMVDTSMSTTDQRGTHIGDVMVEDIVGREELPVLGATPRGYEDLLKTRLNQALNDSGRSREVASSSLYRSGETAEQDSDDAFELLKDTPTFDSSDVMYESAVNTSDISTTDELFARIAELESKILNTENQLAHDESIKLLEESNSRTPLMTNAKSRTTDTRNDTAVASSALQLIFTEETLAMIEQKRLECTPPPSEGEVDNAMIQDAKDNALLGKYLDDTDSEEESTIYKLPDE